MDGWCFVEWIWLEEREIGDFYDPQRLFGNWRANLIPRLPRIATCLLRRRQIESSGLKWLPHTKYVDINNQNLPGREITVYWRGTCKVYPECDTMLPSTTTFFKDDTTDFLQVQRL
jgi:hypothetical protein